MKPLFYPVFLSLALSAMGAAIPASQKEDTLVKRASPGLTAWEDANFTGRSKHYTVPDVQWNTCHTFAEFPAGTAEGISSIAADSGNSCILYPNTVCDPGDNNDDQRLLLIGSYYDLGGSEYQWDKKPASFKCGPY